MPSPVGPVYMFGPPGVKTTEVEPEAALLDVAAVADAVAALSVAVAVEEAGIVRAVALGEMLARMELAWSGVMVVTELEVLATAEAVEELDESEPEDEPLLGCASTPSSSTTVSMNAIVGPATTVVVAWSRMLFARGWLSEVM